MTDTQVQRPPVTPAAGAAAPAAPARSRAPRTPRDSRVLRRLLPFVLPVALVAAWQLAANAHAIDTVLFPSPWQVGQTLGDEARDGSLWENTQVSLVRWALGFLIGGGLGLALGSLVGLSRIAESFLDTSFQMLRTVPHFGLMPLFVLWFGLGEQPKLIMIALSSFFPVYLNTIGGIRNVDAKLIEVGRVHALTWLQLLRRVVLPSALPSIFTGVRYGLGVAWLALIIAELMGATSGLGYLITLGQSLSRTDIVVGGVVIFAVMGKVIDLIVKLAERWLLSWRDTYVGA